MENDTSKTAPVPDLGHDDVGGQECKDGRSRTWMILLYEDNDNMKRVLQETLKELDWNYAGRIHDQEGKPHHHVVVLFKDGRKAKDVAADLGLETRWLRAWDKKKRALRYLCHRDNPEKYQYDTDGIYGTIAEQAISACSKSDSLSESDTFIELVGVLNSEKRFLTYTDAMILFAKKGYYPVFRRMGQFGIRLIEEHNKLFTEEKLGSLRYTCPNPKCRYTTYYMLNFCPDCGTPFDFTECGSGDPARGLED